jgi:hypothetical protein
MAAFMAQLRARNCAGQSIAYKHVALEGFIA